MKITLNLVHNLLNLAIAALGAVLLASGCVATSGGTFDCSQSWISPSVVTIAITGMAVMKIALNIARDGFFGLAKVQPPVEK